jgi:hypothetical protein
VQTLVLFETAGAAIQRNTIAYGMNPVSFAGSSRVVCNLSIQFRNSVIVTLFRAQPISARMLNFQTVASETISALYKPDRKPEGCWFPVMMKRKPKIAARRMATWRWPTKRFQEQNGARALVCATYDRVLGEADDGN